MIAGLSGTCNNEEKIYRKQKGQGESAEHMPNQLNRTKCVRDGKKINVTKCLTGQEIAENHDGPCSDKNKSKNES